MHTIIRKIPAETALGRLTQAGHRQVAAFAVESRAGGISPHLRYPIDASRSGQAHARPPSRSPGESSSRRTLSRDARARQPPPTTRRDAPARASKTLMPSLLSLLYDQRVDDLEAMAHRLDAELLERVLERALALLREHLDEGIRLHRLFVEGRLVTLEAD